MREAPPKITQSRPHLILIPTLLRFSLLFNTLRFWRGWKVGHGSDGFDGKLGGSFFWSVWRSMLYYFVRFGWVWWFVLSTKVELLVEKLLWFSLWSLSIKVIVFKFSIVIYFLLRKKIWSFRNCSFLNLILLNISYNNLIIIKILIFSNNSVLIFFCIKMIFNTQTP